MLSAIVPCFNEAENVELLRAELLPVLGRLPGGYEVVAVDDGSTDDTAQRLAALSHQEPRLRLVRHARNRGLGAALRTGLAEAKGDAVLTLDADLTYSADQVPALFERFTRGGLDCAIGSSFLGGFGDVPSWRLWSTELVNLSYRLRFRWDLTAYTPIFRIYRAQALRGLALSASGFEINAEILVRLVQSGAKIEEIPSFLTDRRRGSSKFRPLAELKNHLRLAVDLAA